MELGGHVVSVSDPQVLCTTKTASRLKTGAVMKIKNEQYGRVSEYAEQVGAKYLLAKRLGVCGRGSALRHPKRAGRPMPNCW